MIGSILQQPLGAKVLDAERFQIRGILDGIEVGGGLGRQVIEIHQTPEKTGRSLALQSG
jgi:hypothetical protein